MNPTPAKSRFHFAKVLGVPALVVFVLFATAFVRAGAGAGAKNAEYEWFKQAYGPERNSEHAEEWILRDFFKSQRDGTFVDVGSFHYRHFSNTYYLEHSLGWSGIAIDAQEEFAADYATFRPRTKFFSFLVSDTSDASGKERTVRTITLNDLLARVGTPQIDFVTMDIELAEPKALAGFDLEKYRPRLVCVEAHPDIRQQLIDYFSDRRYRIVARYLRADPFNLWFAPADARLPKGVEIGHAH